MDSDRFDRMARSWANAAPRRALLAGVIGGAFGFTTRSGEAKKKKKKVPLCLNGLTLLASSKKKKQLLKKGATPGVCAPGGGGNVCNCDPCLRETCVAGSCQCPANMARDSKGVCSIFRSCVSVGQTTTDPTFCCSGRGNNVGIGQFFCIPGNEACAIDIDCLHGQHCVGNLCAPTYIATVGDQCADRAFDICSNRDQCKTGLCEDNLCKTCTSKAQCGDDRPNDGVTCTCVEGLCLTSNHLAMRPVDSCSQCPPATAYCYTLGTLHTCIPLCGRTLN